VNRTPSETEPQSCSGGPASDRRIQDEVFALLADPATFGGGEVRRFDTHGAAVFLAGDRALKVKRAVRFAFLDYSTLQKRKAACLAELEVNRRFAPQLYRRIVPITREPGGTLALDGRGEPIEWAVEMMRFDENQTLDRLAERGALDDGFAARLAGVVLAMHRDAERVDLAPWLAAVEDYLEDNTAAFREHGEIFPADAVAELDRKSRATLRRLRPLLVERGRHGLIRRGHGDLHLGNVAVLDGEPIAFDAIEFDPVVASGDVLYDLAFLLMDLVERDLVRAANVVLNGYFAATGSIEDYDGLAALPFFMSLRAAIRAKVTTARLGAAAPDKRAEIARSAQRYFRLACGLLTETKPRIVSTGGLSGTGKSVLARSLAPSIAPLPGALVLRSDVERKALFGAAETEKLPPDAYRADVSAKIYAGLNDKACRIARAGHSVVVDAVFARPSERAAIGAAAAEAGADFCGFFLTVDLKTRIQRIGGRGPDASDATAEVARQQQEFDLGSVTWNTVDASGTPDQTLARARALLD
jgi:aminoglycoside phosphotransferase family enzyme/predicted kinase